MIGLHKTRLAFSARRVVWVTQVRVSYSRLGVIYSRSGVLLSDGTSFLSFVFALLSGGTN